MYKKLLLLLPLICNCGGAVEAPQYEIMTGKYQLYAGIIDVDPDCKLPYEKTWFDMYFNSEGQPASPFPGIDCTVMYQPVLTITCRGYGAKVVAEGKLFDRYAWGKGRAAGDYAGCTWLDFWWSLRSKQ